MKKASKHVIADNVLPTQFRDQDNSKMEITHQAKLSLSTAILELLKLKKAINSSWDDASGEFHTLHECIDELLITKASALQLAILDAH